MLCTIGKVEQRDIDQIKALEEELGRTIIAFQCKSETRPAELKKDELQKIRELEEKLHLALVVVEY